MNKKILYVGLLAIVFIFFSNSASATKMMISVTDYSTVSFNYDSKGYTNIAAPQFGVDLDFDENNVWDLNTIGYCIDIPGEISATTYFNVALDPVTLTYNTNFLRAAWLMDEFADGADSLNKQAALQLAIWEAVYEDFFTSTVTGDIYNYYTAYNGTTSTSMWADLNYTYEIVTIPSQNDVDLTNYQEILIRTSPVPEPATMLLFGIGLLGISAVGRKRGFKA